jgi:hypothetical protein
MPVSTAYKKFLLSVSARKLTVQRVSLIPPSHCCEISAHFFISFKPPLGGEVASQVGTERGWEFLREKDGGRQTKPLKCFVPQFRVTLL